MIKLFLEINVKLSDDYLLEMIKLDVSYFKSLIEYVQ